MGIEKRHFRFDTYPIRQEFSLEHLFDIWKRRAKSNDTEYAQYAKSLIKLVENRPGIMNASPKKPLATKDKELFSQLIDPVISEFRQENAMIGLCYANFFEFFYTTDKLDEVFGKNAKYLESEFFKALGGKNFYGPLLYAYGRILNEFYNATTYFQVPILSFQMECPRTGLIRNFDVEVDHTYADILAVKELPKLSKKELKNLVDNFYDIELLMQHIPPDLFVMKGFAIITVIDSTSTRTIMALKDKLLEKDAIVSRDHFKKLEKLMRSLFGLSDLRMGIAIAGFNDQEFDENSSFAEAMLISNEDVCELDSSGIYESIYVDRMPIILNDLEGMEEKSGLIKKFLKMGLRSLILNPLVIDDHFIGILELGSEKVNGLNNLSMLNMHPVSSSFAIAAMRVSDDIKNQIKAKIQNEFTAIHPVVEWKFDEAAAQIMKEERGADKTEREPIVFKEVYPLYGAIDIRSSSHERNKAIVNDLVEQLKDARNLLSNASRRKKMPVFSQLTHQIDDHIGKLDKGLLSGDETRIIEFLRREVEPVFRHFKEAMPDLKGIIENYEKKIHPEHGMLYKRRNDFEESIGRINDTISEIIDKQERSAQDMFPHYFEKYRTDGIEYSIYMGQSILEKLTFDPVYLKNLRLWELIVMCEIARKTEEIKDELPIPLETTQLVLVHSNPLDIRFRQDEKKFDVEGGYNIRYEIIKKRIDKALIKGSGERLTQPGSISIIYSQPDEYLEYKKYLDYLISINYIQKKIETHELEDMQGVFGLQAMRVYVNIDKKRKKELSNMEEIIEETKNLN